MDLGTIIEHLITGLLGGGAVGGAMALRRPRPGTPADHEERLQAIERDKEQLALHDQRLEAVERRQQDQEVRMRDSEKELAGDIARLTEAVDSQRRATERLSDSVDGLHRAVANTDVKATLEVEMRQIQRQLELLARK